MRGGGSSQVESIDGLSNKTIKATKASILVVDDEPAVLRVLITRLQLESS